MSAEPPGAAGDPADDAPSGSGASRAVDQDSGQDSGEDPAQDPGADAVRAALNRARTAAAARGAAASANRVGSRPGRREPDRRRSGSGPDARDPQPVGSSISRLVDERGWRTPIAVGGVIGRWDRVVGAEVAGHCTPESFVDGVLTVRADSSAWATQVRLLVPTLLRRLAEEVGEGTVDRVVVKGPSAPSWRKGPRISPGSQGPRDTYG